jgi:hypothetical protein
VKAALRRRQCRQQILERSSMLRRAQYIVDQKVLVLQFINGTRYAYADVPPSIWDGLIEADSAGQYFNQNIRYSFAYRRLNDRDTPDYEQLPRVNR